MPLPPALLTRSLRIYCVWAQLCSQELTTQTGERLRAPTRMPRQSVRAQQLAR